METWEYLVVLLSFDSDTQGWIVHEGTEPPSIVESQGEALNRVGEAGWELVSVVAQEWEPTAEVGSARKATAPWGGGVETFRTYFKRRKP